MRVNQVLLGNNFAVSLNLPVYHGRAKAPKFYSRYAPWTHFCLTTEIANKTSRVGIVDNQSLTPLQTGNPFLGTSLVEVSIGRNFGALKGVKSAPHTSVRDLRSSKPACPACTINKSCVLPTTDKSSVCGQEPSYGIWHGVLLQSGD